MIRKIKGVVLAAGLGTRLKPLTDHWPKPLVPFLGSNALELALWRLKVAGIDHVAVNSHHLPDQIAEALRGNPWQQNLHLSYEPTILGTGGVYPALHEWRQDATLVILNGDIISSMDLVQLLKIHSSSNAVATMALLPHVIPGETAVWHDQGLVKAITKTPIPDALPANFACAQVLSPSFLKLLPDSGTFDIVSQGYQVALRKGLRIACMSHLGLWHDLRNPDFYFAALKDTLRFTAQNSDDPLGLMKARAIRGLPSISAEEGLLIDTDRVHPQALLRPFTVIERGASLEATASIFDSVILPEAKVERLIERSIVGPTFIIPLAESTV